MVLSYKGANKKNSTTLEITATGNGGVNEWKAHLKEDEIQYVLYRWTEDRNLENIVEKRKVDVFLTWMGKVTILERGRKKGHVPEVAGFLQPHKVDLEAINLANVTEENVRRKCDAASGSHVID